MSSWDRHLDDVAAATGRLLLLGDIPLATSMSDTRGVLACRDAYVTGLSGLIGAVTDAPAAVPVTAPTAGRPLTLLDITHRPGLALHQALAELPRVAGPVATPAVQVQASLPPYAELWQDAARACAALEPFREPLARVLDENAWSVLRDLADLAAAVPLLDHALSEALLPALKGGADLAVPYAMLTSTRHDALRLCADEIRTRVPAADPGVAGPAALPRVMGPGELDRAMAGYVRTVAARTEQLSTGDLRAISRLVEFGGDDAARVLRRATPAVPCGAEVADSLQAVSVLAGQLRERPSTSTAPERPDVIGDSAQLQRQVQALAVREHRLPHDVDDTALRRLAGPALEFAKHVPDLTRALEAGVRACHVDGLGPSRSMSAGGNVRWLDPGRSATVTAVRVHDDARALAAAGQQVGPAVWTAQGDLRRGRQSTDHPVTTSPGQQPDVQAGIARAQFRATLSRQLAKSPTQHTTPLPAHPRATPAQTPGRGR